MLRAIAATDTQHTDDMLLAKAVSDGDTEASNTLVSSLLPHVRTTIRYIINNDQDADDIAQDTVVQILANVASYRGKGSLKAWADTIAMRKALRHMQKNKRRKNIFEFFYAPFINAFHGDATKKMAGSDFEVRRSLAKCLNQINPERRVVLVLKLVHHYKVAEIADMLHIPTNTVRDRLAKGRKQLRTKILVEPRLSARLEEMS